MAAKQKTKTQPKQGQEADGVFILKIVLYFVLGSLWVHLGSGQERIAIPFGLILGLIIARHDHFAIDRKLEYMALLGAAVLSFFVPSGFLLQI